MRRLQNIVVAVLFVVGVVSCSKEKMKIIEEPQPDEPELITTVRVKATNENIPGDTHYFSYKVENSFHSANTQFEVDTIKLMANSVYNIEVTVLNEKKNPPIDVTQEIISENNAHLFYYTSNPTSGAGSIIVSERDKDDNGQDFARVCKWKTGTVGDGEIEIILIHGPRNKEATSRAAIAGATDAETVFPVKLY